MLVLRIQPDEGISVRFGAKVPGTRGDVRPVNMDFRYGTSFGVEPPEAYERLLLDAMIGVMSVEQNNIIKIFSVAAVVLMPPTLIASIYGMNFKHMPELDWHFGYPLALVLMLIAAILPYWFFKWKRWL